MPPPPPSTSILFAEVRVVARAQGGVLLGAAARLNATAELGVRYLARARVVVTVTMGAAPQIWPNGYQRRALIRIPPGSIYGGATLSGVLVRISRTLPELRSIANGGVVNAAAGWDIRFETTAGAKLPHIVDRYEPTTGQLDAWVRLPVLEPGQNNDLYIYAGKAGLGAGEANPAGCAVDYIAWWNTVTGVDYTGQPGRSLTMAGGPAQAAVIGWGANYDGVDDQGSVAPAAWFGGWSALTIRAVVNPDAGLIGQTRGIIVQGPADGRGTECGLALYFRPRSADNVDLNVLLANVSCGSAAAQQAFAVSKAGGAEAGLQALTSTWQSGEAPKLYKSRLGELIHGILLPLNNSAVGTGTVQALPVGTPGTLRLGRGVNSTAAGFLEAGPFKGLLDEVRLRAAVMTAAHIATEDFSLLDPEAFFGIGSFDAFDDQNRGPVAVPDFASTAQNTPVLIDAAANDHDPEGQPRTLVSVEAPTPSGTAVIDTNRIRYTPAAGFSGAAALRYTVRDAGAPQKTSVGKVRVEVTGSTPLPAGPEIPAALRTFTVNNDAELTAREAAAIPGDRIILNPGNYTLARTFARSGTAGAPIVYMAVNPQATTIQAGQWVNGANWRMWHGLNFRGNVANRFVLGGFNNILRRIDFAEWRGQAVRLVNGNISATETYPTGGNNTIDYCGFHNPWAWIEPATPEPSRVAIRPRSNSLATFQYNLTLRHCRFHDLPEKAGAPDYYGQSDAIEFSGDGSSHPNLNNAGWLLEYILVDNHEGRDAVIDIKSGGSIFRYVTILNCQNGRFDNRYWNGNRYEGIWLESCGGMDFLGTDHLVNGVKMINGAKGNPRLAIVAGIIESNATTAPAGKLQYQRPRRIKMIGLDGGILRVGHKYTNCILDALDTRIEAPVRGGDGKLTTAVRTKIAIPDVSTVDDTLLESGTSYGLAASIPIVTPIKMTTALCGVTAAWAG